MSAHRSMTSLTLAAAAASGLTAPALAKPPGGPGGPAALGHGCIYYEHANFEGAREDVREGDDVAWVGTQWNDRISSIQCAPGCRLLAFEDVDYGGAATRFAGSIRYVGDAWNDRISSLRVSCRGRGQGVG